MANDIKIYKSRWIVPVSKHPLKDSYIIVSEDKIHSVVTELQEEYKDYEVVDLGNSVVFPAFVNTHIHLEHSSPVFVPTNFKEYLFKCYEEEREPDDIRKNTINENIKDVLGYGTIAVADFSSDGISVNPLIESELFARVFIEIKGFRRSQKDFILKRYKDIIDFLPVSKKVTCHFTPSSLALTNEELLRAIFYREKHIAMHFGFEECERQLLLNCNGLLKQYLLSVEDYDFDWKCPGKSPVNYMMENMLYTKHNLLVHCCDLTEEEIERLKELPEKINISIAPRVYDSLSIKPPDIHKLIENGFNICLGTESRVVNNDLDLRNEMIRCVTKFKVSYDNALKFATLNGAYAIGFHREVGSLEPGKVAKCLVIKNIDEEIDDPYKPIFNPDYKIEWLL